MDLEFNVTGWASGGETRWSHNAAVLNAIWGIPTSELVYEDIDSDIVELSVALPHANNKIRFAIGGGVIDSGRLVDDDYVSAAGATYYGATVSGAHRISRTHSDITGSGLFYLNAEYHPELLRFEIAGQPLQLYAGLHYWREEYRATGIRQIECTDSTASNGRTFCNPVGFVGYTDQIVITNKVNWTTWYVGAQGQLHLSQATSLHLKLNYSPFTYLSNEDTHHLRTDLRQDPSFSMTGFGQAIDLELEWRYRFSEAAGLSLGYRYWEREVKDGDWYAYSAGGTSVAPLIQMRTIRKGLTLGFNMVF
jgi:hypothetical protein